MTFADRCRQLLTTSRGRCHCRSVRLPSYALDDIRCAAATEGLEVDEWVLEQLAEGVRRVMGNVTADVIPIRFRS